MRSTLKTIACAAMALALTVVLAVPAPATARHYDSTCANRLCTKDRPHVKKCRSYHGHKRVARCFIRRAARHFHQSKRRAYYIAWRESRYNWHATNSSSGAAGLYQFMRGTWRHTPYRDHSRYSPRWAPLAAMWMWKHGGYSHWQ
jgi:hypothetical protein